MADAKERFQLRTVFLGPPGAGKGTQAARLAGSRKIPHISTGDLFRAAVAEGSDLGRKVKDYLNSGRLVPDDLVNDLVDWRLRKPDAERSFVFDGFPRTSAQADALERMLADRSLPLAIVVNFEVADEVLVERASSRLVCRGCGSPYNSVSAPPHTQGICDKCGQPLYRRADDQPEVVRERLQVYRVQTSPLIDYYNSRSLLRTVHADRAIDAVAREIDRMFIKNTDAITGAETGAAPASLATQVSPDAGAEPAGGNMQQKPAPAE